MAFSVCLGGHWKGIEAKNQDIEKNRREVVSRRLDSGVNYVDASCRAEAKAYCAALAGLRDRIYLELSHCNEVRNSKCRTADKLMEGPGFAVGRD